MPHYVLIENHSGYVWGEADASDPVEACAKVDREIGGEARQYEEARISNSTVNGYFVYEAPADWEPINDGTDQSEVQRVESTCRKVTEVTAQPTG